MSQPVAASILPLLAVLLLGSSEGNSASETTFPESCATDEWLGDWTMIDLEGETGCAFGTSFRFFYREGPDPSRLMIYFQGGGACWNWVSCSGMFDTSVTDDELLEFRGIFDFTNPENPFREYSVIFVPYCTGDVHVGDTIAQHGQESWNAPAVEHRGWRNVTAVLDWAEAQVPQPSRLVVTGASAGSYGALFHAAQVAESFPGAELTVIGDSGVPLLHEYPQILEEWGAARKLRQFWASRIPEDESAISLETAHERLAGLYSDAIIAQITTNQDAIQKAFYIFSGSAEWRTVTLNLVATLEERLPTFHAFVLAGSDHGLMRTNQFYSYEENGVRLSEWVDDLVNKRPVTSQYCEGCDGISR